MVMLLVAAIVLLPLVPAGAVAASAVYAGYSYYTATVRAANLPHLQPYAFQDARIYDRYGTLLYEVGDPLHGERRPVPLAAVPLALQQATIAVEDKTFYANPGFDVRGVPARPAGGRMSSNGDHRIAMLGAIAGLVSRNGVEVGDAEAVAISFPGFFDVLRSVTKR